MTKYKLEQLVIKPTLACTSNCPTCSFRKDLHKELIKRKSLSVEQWLKVFDNAESLGTRRLDISGGEPTLYKRLTDLISAAKGKGWYVNLNSNGSQITEAYAYELLRAGLDSIAISLYSPYPDAHDKMRCNPGLWKKATSAVRIFAELRKRYPKFSVITQTLLMRENYKSLPELIELHYNLGSQTIAFTYLEGDFDKKFLLNKNEIADFKENTLPKAIDFCKKLPASVRQDAISTLESCYSEKITSIANFAKGIYRPKEAKMTPCQRPKNFALILANGDVHPCNMVEYSHEPVMGNIFDSDLVDIWQSEKWNKFREELFDYCILCPINLYMSIPLRLHLDNSFLGKIYYSSIFAPFRNLARRVLKALGAQEVN